MGRRPTEASSSASGEDPLTFHLLKTARDSKSNRVHITELPIDHNYAGPNCNFLSLRSLPSFPRCPFCALLVIRSSLTVFDLALLSFRLLMCFASFGFCRFDSRFHRDPSPRPRVIPSAAVAADEATASPDPKFWLLGAIEISQISRRHLCAYIFLISTSITDYYCLFFYFSSFLFSFFLSQFFLFSTRSDSFCFVEVRESRVSEYMEGSYPGSVIKLCADENS